MAAPDAWDDDWSTAADKSLEAPQQKPTPAKVTKAQRRAQQAEFNRQLWEEAEGGPPAEPNYFLQTRGIVPKPDEFKPPPRLLSRKGPTSQSKGKNDSSDDDDGEGKKKELTAEEKRALAAKEREEKQRKYEERRQELFGTTTTTTTGNSTNPIKSGSTTSSPAETPPGSRSATPNRGRGGRGGNRKAEPPRPVSSSASSLSLRPSSLGPTPSSRGEKKELFDPNYTAKRPEATKSAELKENVIQPIRTPRGPDGSGRGGFGFAPRGGKVDA